MLHWFQGKRLTETQLPGLNLYFVFPPKQGHTGDWGGSNALERGLKKTGRGSSCEGSLPAGAQLLQFYVPSALQGASEPRTAALKQN